jgi:hypothetical protein
MCWLIIVDICIQEANTSEWGVRYQCCTWWHPFGKYSIEVLTLLHCFMHGVLREKKNWTRLPSIYSDFLTDVFECQR